MSNEELVALYQNSESEADRQGILRELYLKNEGLIGKVASRYSGIEELDDLRQEGYFGLVTAAEKWSPEGGATFASYAWDWIRQSMQRYIDDCGSCIRISVHRREQLLRYRRYCSEYAMAHGRQPSDRDLMLHLGVSLDQLEAIRKADLSDQMRSLSDPVPGDDIDLVLGDTIADPRDMIEEAEDQIQRKQLGQTIWKAVDDLGAKESTVIRMRYQDGKTLKECGADLGVSLDRARQIEAKALRKLRTGKIAKALQPFLEGEAIRYGYHSSGLGAFRQTGSSSVERAILAWERRLEEIYADLQRHRERLQKAQRAAEQGASDNFIG